MEQDGAFQLPEVVLTPRAAAGSKARARAPSRTSGVVPASSSSSALPSQPRLPRASSPSRSRSPDRMALPGLRSDAPGRLARVRAHPPDLSAFDQQQAALAALDRDVMAATTSRSNSARLATIQGMLRQWEGGGVSSYPGLLESSGGFA